MTLHPVPLGGPTTAGLTLKPFAVAQPALSSHIRPALVLGEAEARSLQDAATTYGVGRGGHFHSGPACVQVWDRPWDTAGEPGAAALLGSVDWSFDTPARGYLTIYRAMVTASGVAAGQSTLSVLQAVLGLAGLAVEPDRITAAAPPARDPFRRPA